MTLRTTKDAKSNEMLNSIAQSSYIEKHTTFC